MPANILLVEGNDDLHVFCNLFEYHNINETFKVEEKGGFSNILKTIPVYLKGSEITRLGVVLDADDSFQTRWEAIRSCFARENYPMPILPTSDGVIVEVDKRPRIGVWVMPDNAASGTVEDFVTALIPPDDELKIYASDAIECIP